MPISPPADPSLAKAQLRAVLRARRGIIAEQGLTTWQPRITDVARAGGVDRSTIRAWAKESPGIRTAKGRVIFRNIDPARIPELDLRLKNKQPPQVPAQSDTDDQCSTVFIGKSSTFQRILAHDPGPVPWKSLAFSELATVIAEVGEPFGGDLTLAAPKSAEIGSIGQPVTVSELAVLADCRISAATVRRLLRESGLDLRPGQTIDPAWFSSPNAHVFWGLVNSLQQKRREKRLSRRNSA